MNGLAESGSNPMQAMLILANTVRIYLQMRTGAASTSSGFYGYLNTQQRICNPSPAITLTWMELSNNSSFLKDTFSSASWVALQRETHIFTFFHRLENQCTQRCNSRKWQASSPDRNKTWVWCAFLQCTGVALESHAGVESLLLPSNLSKRPLYCNLLILYII